MKVETPLSPIRPALITRLYKAIDQHRLSDAILLLSQQYSGSQLQPEQRAKHFLEQLREEGERMVFAEKVQQAEELFGLSLALYDRFFPNLYVEGLAAARRLSELMSGEKRDAELMRALDYASEIVRRFDFTDRAGAPTLSGHGKIADALVRRHQIATYVDLVAHNEVYIGTDAKPLQVLIIEDNDDDAGIVEEALMSTELLTIKTSRAQTMDLGLAQLRSGEFDIVVLDLGLPDSGTDRTLQRVSECASNAPIIVLTGTDDDDIAMRAIKYGAHDYLVKNKTNPSILLRSVLRAAEERLTPKIPETPSNQVIALIEHAPNAMMHLSADFTVFAMNSAFVSLLGSDWSGKHLVEVWPLFSTEGLIRASENGRGMDFTDIPLPSESAHKGTISCSIWPTRTTEEVLDGFVFMVTKYNVPPLVSISGEPAEVARERDLEAQLAAGRDEEQRLREKIAQQTALAKMSQMAQLNTDEKELFQQAMTGALEAIGADTVVLLRKDSESKLRLQACSSEISPALMKLEGNLNFEPMYRFAYNSATAVAIDDLTKEPFARPPKSLLDLGIKSGTMVQVSGREEPYGLLCAFYKDTHRSRDSESMFLAALAGILAASIERRQIDAQLQLVADELQRSNTDLQQFAYAAAHDLQEPLRSVVSYLELLHQRLEGTLDEKGEKYINVATAAGKRMQGLINDLLEYSRISTRGQALVRTEMSEVLKFTLNNLQSAIADSQATIQIDDLPTVAVDASQMIQLFQNLIANAIKFQKPGLPPRIHIYAIERPGFWEFVVKDYGIGMDMEYADRIFVIFQRLHTRTKYDGSGIGLALCKKIIERHAGKIWVESEVDQGAEFHFTVPSRM